MSTPQRPTLTQAAGKSFTLPQWTRVLIATVISTLLTQYGTQVVSVHLPGAASVLVIGTVGGLIHHAGEVLQSYGVTWWPT